MFKTLRIIAAVLVLTSAAAPATAGGGGGGGCGGCATEVTQLMNNAELVLSYGQQVQMVANQINAYRTMLQNLMTLPTDLVSSVMGDNFPDINWQISQYTSLYQGAQRLYSSTMDVQRQFEFAANASSRLNMDPQTYLKNITLLAHGNNVYYQQMRQNSIQSMQALENDGAAVQQLGNSISGINGNVKGFQTLAASNVQIASLLRDVKAEMIKQNDAIGQKGMIDGGVSAAEAAEMNRVKSAVDAMMGKYKPNSTTP